MKGLDKQNQPYRGILRKGLAVIIGQQVTTLVAMLKIPDAKQLGDLERQDVIRAAKLLRKVQRGLETK